MSESGGSCSTGPGRVKRELRDLSPNIIQLNEFADPGSLAVKELLKALISDSEFIGSRQSVEQIYTSSCAHAVESAPRAWWMIDVAILLLKGAISDLRLQEFVVHAR